MSEKDKESICFFNGNSKSASYQDKHDCGNARCSFLAVGYFCHIYRNVSVGRVSVTVLSKATYLFHQSTSGLVHNGRAVVHKHSAYCIDQCLSGVHDSAESAIRQTAYSDRQDGYPEQLTSFQNDVRLFADQGQDTSCDITTLIQT